MTSIIMIKLIVVFILSAYCLCCTDFKYGVVDGSIFSARTMDFPIVQLTKLKFTGPDQYYQTETLSWYITEGFLSFSPYGENHTVDGLNTCGLSCASLSLQQSEYQSYSSSSVNLGVSYVCDWILSQFCSTDDVSRNISMINIYDNKPLPRINTPLLHLSIHDETGNSLVIEFINGSQVHHNNKIGILTNDPVYNWHIINIQNYNYISNLMKNYTVKINNWDSSSEYSMISTPNYGISADDGPVSRFIRISQHIRFMHLPSNADSAVVTGFRLLEKVAVVPGFTFYQSQLGNLIDITLYRCVRDHTNRRIYFTTYNNLLVKMIDLKNLANNSNSVFLEKIADINFINITEKFN